MVEKILPQAGFDPGTARSVGQCFPTELPGLLSVPEGKLIKKKKKTLW